MTPSVTQHALEGPVESSGPSHADYVRVERQFDGRGAVDELWLKYVGDEAVAAVFKDESIDPLSIGLERLAAFRRLEALETRLHFTYVPHRCERDSFQTVLERARREGR